MTDLQKLDRNFVPVKVADGLQWVDVRDLGIEGRGWPDCEPFHRLPDRARSIVRPPVWNLSCQSAGLAVRFETDAVELSARWTLREQHIGLAMDHMPATGVSGLDLYAREPDGWHWAGVGRPACDKGVEQKAQLTAGLRPGKRLFCLYLPLYNGVHRVEIGLPPGCTISAAPRPKGERPVCIYGTSIVQGGCASRPGMVYSSLLGRRLDREVINLGFSGNGPLDPEMAPLLAEMDPCVYVLDPLPNMQPDQVLERTAPFVSILRDARPATPIVLIENITYQRTPLLAAPSHVPKNLALRKVFRELQSKGVPHLHLVAGEPLLGSDGDATVDGTHLTDLGFYRFTEALLPVLKPLL